MKKKLLCVMAITCALLYGCGNKPAQVEQVETTKEAVSEMQSEATETDKSAELEETTEESSTEDSSDQITLEDGVYVAEFHTDSSMFHVSEACEGKGVLTVVDGVMTIHVSLASKNILNLYPGLAEDASKDGAQLLEPTIDEVTYSDGLSEEVYGFDIPVPAIDEEFDLALIGKKEKWYDHKVVVTNPVADESICY